MYADLPEHVQLQARRFYRLFRQDPTYPGLNFKKVDGEANIYSARVGRGYRALGQMDGADIVWFWIGAHAVYDRMI